MKKILSVLLTVAMLVTTLSMFQAVAFAETFAETIYFKCQDSSVNSSSQVRLTYHADDGEKTVTMRKDENGFYAAEVNGIVSELRFQVGSAQKNYTMTYDRAEYNCVFVPQGSSAVWGSYTDGIFSLEKPLYLTPNEEWKRRSTRFIVQFKTTDGKTVTEEMTPVGDGSYVTYDRENISSYKFGALRENATALGQTVYLSSEITRENPEYNHFILEEGTTGVLGVWELKHAEEELPPGSTEPMPEDDVQWGYSESYSMGYGRLVDVLNNYSGASIYIKLIKPVHMEEALFISEGRFFIDLDDYSILINSITPVELSNTEVTLLSSGDGSVRALNPDSQYMFELTNSRLEIQGGTYETSGKGIVTHTDNSSSTTINGGFFEAKECVASIPCGTLVLNGGFFLGNFERAQIVYEADSYDSNIVVKNMGDPEISFLIANENLSVSVNELGPENKVAAFDAGESVETVIGGKVHTLKVYVTIRFIDTDETTTLIKGEPYRLPVYDGVPPSGKKFVAWEDVLSGRIFDIETEHPIDADMELRPVWEDAETITVTYGANGGSGTMEPVAATKSSPYILPECTFTPPAGMVFSTWQIEGRNYPAGASVVFESDTDVIAVWKNGIMVRYIANGGSGEDVTFYVSGGTTITLEENMFTAPEGKTFSGWKVNGKESAPGKTINITSNTDITAQWTDGYYVTYSANGGKGSDIKRNYVGETTITLPENTFTAPENKHFKCWEINGTEYLPGAEITVNSETFVYAKWEDSYTIKYVYTYTASDGTELTREKTETVAGGTEYTLKYPEELFTAIPEQYVPQYWREKLTVQHRFGESITVNKNYTLTLIYKIKYNLNFNPANDIDSFKNYEVFGDEIFTIPEAPQNSPEGKGFVCWTDRDGEEYNPGDVITVTKNMQFTAQWLEYTELSKLCDSVRNGIEERKIYHLPETTLINGEYVPVYWELKYAGPTGTTLMYYDLEAQAYGSFVLVVSAGDYSEEVEVWVHCDYNNGFCKNCGGYEKPVLKDGYYQIENTGNLYWFSQKVNDASDPLNREINAILLKDIDLEGKSDGSGRKWIPIGISGGATAQNFRGIFDGNGKTITGLYVDAWRHGLGFFGEVRDGIVKNFTIYGDVKVQGKYDYIGGVIGSACGTADDKGALVSGVTSYVNVTLGEGSHGSNRVAGFIGYVNHNTLVENCLWYGKLDLDIYRAQDGVGGLIGKANAQFSGTIRNCGAYGIIETAYTKGSYVNPSNVTAFNDIFIGGILSNCVKGAQANIENCIWAGVIIDETDLGENAKISAFGTMNGLKSLKNCYYLEYSAPYVYTNGYTNIEDAENTSVTKAQLESGEVAYKLGGAWGQAINTNAYPLPEGTKVYKYSDGYSNELKLAIAEYTEGGAVINIPEAGTYSLIFADYEGKSLNATDIVTVTVTADKVGKITIPSEIGITLGEGDKIMLWNDWAELAPLCEEYIVE